MSGRAAPSSSTWLRASVSSAFRRAISKRTRAVSDSDDAVIVLVVDHQARAVVELVEHQFVVAGRAFLIAHDVRVGMAVALVQRNQQRPFDGVRCASAGSCGKVSSWPAWPSWRPQLGSRIDQGEQFRDLGRHRDGVTVTLAFAVDASTNETALIGDRFGGMNIQREQRSRRYEQQPTHGNPFLVFQTLFYQ